MADHDCGIERAAGVLGDPWTPLLLRDVARGRTRFEQLLGCGVSRKVLAARLVDLVDAGTLRRDRYQEKPDRYAYHLTERGRDLLPVLAALQDWGDGHGLSAVVDLGSPAARRVAALVGTTVPDLEPDPLGPDLMAGRTPWTVVYTFPGTAAPGLDGVPGGTAGAAWSLALRDRATEFSDLGARLVGVSTQTPPELDGFGREHRIWFPLVPDPGLATAASLRLPTFRLGGALRLCLTLLVVDDDRVVRGTLLPDADAAATVEPTLALVRSLAG